MKAKITEVNLVTGNDNLIRIGGEFRNKDDKHSGYFYLYLPKETADSSLLGQDIEVNFSFRE